MSHKNLNFNFFIQEATGPMEMTLKLKETGFGPLQEIIGWFFLYYICGLPTANIKYSCLCVSICLSVRVRMCLSE